MLDWSAVEMNRLALWPDDCKINLRKGESKSSKLVKGEGKWEEERRDG